MLITADKFVILCRYRFGLLLYFIYDNRLYVAVYLYVFLMGKIIGLL